MAPGPEILTTQSGRKPQQHQLHELADPEHCGLSRGAMTASSPSRTVTSAVAGRPSTSRRPTAAATPAPASPLTS